MALFKRNEEPSDSEVFRDELRQAAKAQKERLMKFRVKPGYEQGFVAGDLKGVTDDIVECSPERGKQLANWLDPAEPWPWDKTDEKPEGSKEEETVDDDTKKDPPGAPPAKANANISGAPNSGGSRPAAGKGKAAAKPAAAKPTEEKPEGSKE